MALKIRQKKKNNDSQEPNPHLRYQPNTGKHWAEQYRDKNNKSVRRSLIAVIVAGVVIIAILIAAAVKTIVDNQQQVNEISVTDSFAVSQKEQNDMQEKSKLFAEGILYYAYCSDRDVALQGKNAALALMASNTTAYSQIDKISQVNPVIAKDNFVAVTTTPTMQSPTKVYAGDFTYTFSAVAVDSSQTTENNPDGVFMDSGYNFTIKFSYADDTATNERSWIITDASITAK